jgi:hypothetical protein
MSFFQFLMQKGPIGDMLRPLSQGKYQAPTQEDVAVPGSPEMSGAIATPQQAGRPSVLFRQPGPQSNAPWWWRYRGVRR